MLYVSFKFQLERHENISFFSKKVTECSALTLAHLFLQLGPVLSQPFVFVRVLTLIAASFQMVALKLVPSPAVGSCDVRKSMRASVSASDQWACGFAMKRRRVGVTMNSMAHTTESGLIIKCGPTRGHIKSHETAVQLRGFI